MEDDDTIELSGHFCYKRNPVEGDLDPTKIVVHLDSFFKEASPLAVYHYAADEKAIPFTLSGRVPPRAPLPRDARIVFHSWVSTKNANNIVCLEDCGLTSEELYEIDQSHHHQSGGQYTVDLEVRMQTTMSRDLKGTFTVTFTSLKRNGMPNTVPYNMSEMQNSASYSDRALKIINDYTYACMDETEKLVIVADNTETINCYLYLGPVTQRGGTSAIMLPMAAYVMYQAPSVARRWWEQQMTILASRLEFADLNAFCIAFLASPPAKQAVYTVAFVSQYVQMLEYVPDKSGKHVVEMFGDALRALFGDCEDFALGIKQIDTALVNENFRTKENKIQHNVRNVLTCMQTLLSAYESLLTLDGVTNASLQDGIADGENVEVSGAHSADKYIPRDYFAECVARFDATHPLATLGMDAKFKGILPCLFAEGTGILWPEGVHDEFAPVRRALYDSDDVIHTIKKTVYDTPPNSRFYKIIIEGVLPTFLTTHRVGTFDFCYRLPDGKLSKGVPYSMIAQRSPLVIIKPRTTSGEKLTVQTYVSTEKVISSTFVPEFSTELLHLMQNVVRTRVPPPFIEEVDGSPVDTDMARIRNPVLDAICTSLKNDAPDVMLARSQIITGRIGEDIKNVQKTTVVCFYINPDILTAEFATTFTAAIRGIRVVKEASYYLERHTNEITRYRLRLECFNLAPFVGATSSSSSSASPRRPPTMVKSHIGQQMTIAGKNGQKDRAMAELLSRQEQCEAIQTAISNGNLALFQQQCSNTRLLTDAEMFACVEHVVNSRNLSLFISMLEHSPAMALLFFNTWSYPGFPSHLMENVSTVAAAAAEEGSDISHLNPSLYRDLTHAESLFQYLLRLRSSRKVIAFCKQAAVTQWFWPWWTSIAVPYARFYPEEPDVPTRLLFAALLKGGTVEMDRIFGSVRSSGEFSMHECYRLVHFLFVNAERISASRRTYMLLGTSRLFSTFKHLVLPMVETLKPHSPAFEQQVARSLRHMKSFFQLESNAQWFWQTWGKKVCSYPTNLGQVTHETRQWIELSTLLSNVPLSRASAAYLLSPMAVACLTKTAIGKILTRVFDRHHNDDVVRFLLCEEPSNRFGACFAKHWVQEDTHSEGIFELDDDDDHHPTASSPLKKVEDPRQFDAFFDESFAPANNVSLHAHRILYQLLRPVQHEWQYPRAQMQHLLQYPNVMTWLTTIWIPSVMH